MMLDATPIPWMNAGACNNVDPGIFYPEHGYNVAAGIDVCRSCDVREQCLTYALEADERWGIWGGLTAEQRWDINRAKNVRSHNGALTHCKHGHKFTPENTRIRKRGENGTGRQCRACENARRRDKRAADKDAA